MRILVAEDDDFLAEGLCLALRDGGYFVDQAKSGQEADDSLTLTQYDLLVLDLGLPAMDGLDVLKRLRGRGQATPVLILTARDSVTDRVQGLDQGANDYMTKPFDLPELEARIRAMLRKENWGNMVEIVHGNLRFDTVGRRVTVDGTGIDLSARELAVLELLLQRVGRVVNKAQLIEHLSGWDSDLTYNALEIIMHRLRKKLEHSNCEIRTLRGLGYLIEKS